jgi:hypothetical protein
MEQYHDRIPRKSRYSKANFEAGVFETQLRRAATIYSVFYAAELFRSKTSTYATLQPDGVHQQKPSLLEELVTDRNALKHFHLCTDFQRETYLDLYRKFLLLKSQAPYLIARLPEKRSLNDLCFWQQLGWILNEHTYMGQPLEGFTQLPPEHRKIAALCSCEVIVERMREEDAQLHVVMKNWSAIFDSIRDLFQTTTRLTSREVRRQAANSG